MVSYMDNGNPMTIDNHKGVGNSLKKDHKADNLKRACFMLHYSANNAYQSLFSKSLCQYHAEKFMESINVRYAATTGEKRAKEKTGCVEQLAIRTFHQQKFMIIQMLKSVHVNVTTRLKKGNGQDRAAKVCHPRGLNFVYYHTVGSGASP